MILAAIIFPIFANARYNAVDTICLSNMKNIGVALQMYTEDNESNYPSEKSWSDSLSPYIRGNAIQKCPCVPQYGYAMNSKISGKSSTALMKHTSVQTPVVFETDILSPNLSIPFDLAKIAYRHQNHRASNILYLDGHVGTVRKNEH